MFHVVKHSHNDQFQSYSIYYDNEPFLKPIHPDLYLGRVEAAMICRELNRSPLKKRKK